MALSGGSSGSFLQTIAVEVQRFDRRGGFGEASGSTSAVYENAFFGELRTVPEYPSTSVEVNKTVYQQGQAEGVHRREAAATLESRGSDSPQPPPVTPASSPAATTPTALAVVHFVPYHSPMFFSGGIKPVPMEALQNLMVSQRPIEGKTKPGFVRIPALPTNSNLMPLSS